MTDSAGSILVVDETPFGQSLALIPAMRALRVSDPKAFLVAAAPSGTCELLTSHQLADDTLPLGVIKQSDGASSNTFKRLWALVRRSRHYNFDLVLDFSSKLETQLISRLFLRSKVISPSGLPGALGFLMELGGLSRSAGAPGLSAYESVLRQAGVELADGRLSLRLSADEDSQFEKRLSASGYKGGELLILLYCASSGSRNGWPDASFTEIGSRLANHFDARVIVADEPSDDSFTRSQRELPSSAIKLAQPRAEELVAAIARSSIVITDSPSVGKIAAEIGTPAIEIADGRSAQEQLSVTHRIARAASRVRVPTEEVYEIACEMIQESRSSILFRQP